MRKDSAIQEKAGENEALAEEKRRQEEESENTVERMQLAHSVEADQISMESDASEEVSSSIQIANCDYTHNDACI